MKKTASIVIAVCIGFMYLSCDKEESSPRSDFSDTTKNNQNDTLQDTVGTDVFRYGVIDHEYGFRFSWGEADTVHYENDGDIISWHSGWGASPYPQWEYTLWYRNDGIDTINWRSQIRNFGETDILSISSIPMPWDSVIDPLQIGYVFGARCLDGYVLFEVLALDTIDWKADVRYIFNEINSFK